jgi:outer membrane protein assembly factor BamB
MSLALATLVACGEKDIRLSGDRLDIRDGTNGAEAVAASTNTAAPIRLAAQQNNASWTHRNGGPEHLISHPAYSGAFTPVWTNNIGQGDSRRARITADPVVAAGRVFTLDANAQVVATAANSGGTVWSRDLTPGSDGGRDASGGGLAIAGDKLFVTTGFGELVALDVATGTELWTQNLEAPGGSAPTVSGDLVYVAARDSRAWAVEVETGRIRYTIGGTPSEAGFAGGAGVAVAGDLAIFPFPSGEVVASFRQGGLQRWSTSVAGERRGRAAASAASDISGDPVVVGNRVYVGNQSGRLVALDVSNGDRIWTATEGALSPVWPAGDSVFLVNDLNELVRLNDSNGARIWAVPLPVFAETRARRQRTVYAHYGPVLAGGRLIVASSDGIMRAFDPVSGNLVGQAELRGGAASHPVVAGGTLYIVTKRGQLVAFR